MVVNFALPSLSDRSKFDWERMSACVLESVTLIGALTLLAAELGGIHSFAEDLHCQPACFLEVTFLLVVLLQQTLRTCVVRAHAGGFPSTVIPTRIALVKLKLSLRIVASVNKGNTERTKPTMLGVALFDIAEASHKLFAWNVLIVRPQVFLSLFTGGIDENICISRHASDSADHVAEVMS